MPKILILLALAVASCTTANDMYEKEDISAVWVCHNPESSLHGSLCKEKVDTIRGRYETCYWILDGSRGGSGRKVKDSFCWLLERSDCAYPMEFEWQIENCHLLNKFD